MSVAQVSHPEAALLSVARCAVGLTPAAEVARLLASPITPPVTLGPTCRRLLADTLARGTVLALARRGGWYGGPGGRLWDRAALPALEFTPAVVELLQWVLRAPLGERSPPPLRTSSPFTWAEGVLATLLLDQLRGTGWEGALAAQGPLRSCPLVVLAHAAELGRAAPLEAPPPFDPGLDFAVEALRGLLAHAWAAPERLKREVAEPPVLRRVAEAQARVLEAFLASLESPGRRHLATFLVDAMVELGRGGHAFAEAGRSLASQAPLRERSLARRAAAAVPRALGVLEAWDGEHRAVRFFEDGYPQAQALVKDWGRLGPDGFELLRADAAAMAG